MKKLPNYLTIARIVLVPFFILCYYTGLPGWNYWAGGIFIAASLTDMLDGYLARRFACVSKFEFYLFFSYICYLISKYITT